MGLRDTLFGRTKQAAPNLDNLFALPTAALTLQSELDLVRSGQAGLCFKAGSGESSLRPTTTSSSCSTSTRRPTRSPSRRTTSDSSGSSSKTPTSKALVTRIHSADTSMVEHGLGPRLLCAVFGFVPKTPPGEGSVRLVYLMKQGTFYPFAPTGSTQRDNELELRVRSFLSTDLPMEKDLSRWMALWNVPVN